MSRRYFFGLALFIITALTVFSGCKQVTNPDKPDLKTADYDFTLDTAKLFRYVRIDSGFVHPGPQTITVTNTGKKPLSLATELRGTDSAYFTLSPNGVENLAPKDSFSFTIGFLIDNPYDSVYSAFILFNAQTGGTLLTKRTDIKYGGIVLETADISFGHWPLQDNVTTTISTDDSWYQNGMPWFSADESIVQIEKGNVTTLREGQVIVGFVVEDGNKFIVRGSMVTVYPAVIALNPLYPLSDNILSRPAGSVVPLLNLDIIQNAALLKTLALARSGGNAVISAFNDKTGELTFRSDIAVGVSDTVQVELTITSAVPEGTLTTHSGISSFTAKAGDTPAPVFTGARTVHELNAFRAVQVEVEFSEQLSASDPRAGFTVKNSGVSLSIDSASLFSNRITFTVSEAAPILFGDTVTVSYDKGAGTVTSGVLPLESFADKPVTNKLRDVGILGELQAKIEEAETLRKIIKTSTNGTDRYYFEAWITTQNLTSSGLDAALSAAKSAYGNANSTIPELEDAASVLWDAVLALKDMLQSGTQSLPDGTNIASRYGLYTAPETSSGLASNAFNDSASNGTRWIPGVPEPVLEIAFAYPATLGGLEFNAYSTSAGGDSGIRDFRLEYLDGSAWKSAFEYSTPGVSVPGDAGTSSSFETYFTRRYSFDQEYTSVRFRLKVTSSAFNPSFWRIRLLSSTTGRIPLVNAISEAQLNLASVEISTDGSDINLASQWVTQAVHTAYNNAISAALDVTQVNTSTGVQLSGAMEALNTATTAFNNEKKAGSADPVLIAKREALLKKIADTEEWLKLHKTGTAAGNYYPFEFAASSAAKTALNSAITEAKSAPKTNVGEVDEASTAFENAITAFTDVRVTGTMALPAAGANIGNKHAYATETNKHSGTGGMNECLLNTTFLSANANRWGTTSGIVLPANGTVVFSAPVGVSAFKIYSFSSEGSSGTSGNGGRIRSFDIEYWNGTEWALCYRRVETTPIPGIRSQDLSNATTREANAFTAAFTDGRVESDKFRIVINTSIGVDFSIWHLQLLYAPSP